MEGAKKCARRGAEAAPIMDEHFSVDLARSPAGQEAE